MNFAKYTTAIIDMRMAISISRKADAPAGGVSRLKTAFSDDDPALEAYFLTRILVSARIENITIFCNTNS